MKCTTCQDEIDLLSAVERSTRSWPQLQTILHVCPKCSARLYLRFETDAIYLVRAASFLGPKWEASASEFCQGVTVHPAPDGLQIRIGPVNRIVPAG